MQIKTKDPTPKFERPQGFSKDKISMFRRELSLSRRSSEIISPTQIKKLSRQSTQNSNSPPKIIHTEEGGNSKSDYFSEEVIQEQLKAHKTLQKSAFSGIPDQSPAVSPRYKFLTKAKTGFEALAIGRHVKTTESDSENKSLQLQNKSGLVSEEQVATPTKNVLLKKFITQNLDEFQRRSSFFGPGSRGGSSSLSRRDSLFQMTESQRNSLQNTFMGKDPLEDLKETCNDIMLDCAELYLDVNGLEKQLAKYQKGYFYRIGTVEYNHYFPTKKFKSWKNEKFIQKKKEIKKEIQKIRGVKKFEDLDPMELFYGKDLNDIERLKFNQQQYQQEPNEQEERRQALFNSQSRSLKMTKYDVAKSRYAQKLKELHKEQEQKAMNQDDDIKKNIKDINKSSKDPNKGGKLSLKRNKRPKLSIKIPEISIEDTSRVQGIQTTKINSLNFDQTRKGSLNSFQESVYSPSLAKPFCKSFYTPNKRNSINPQSMRSTAMTSARLGDSKQNEFTSSSMSKSRTSKLLTPPSTLQDIKPNRPKIQFVQEDPMEMLQKKMVKMAKNKKSVLNKHVRHNILNSKLDYYDNQYK